MSSQNLIYVLRHGESLEDVDKTAHERMADEDMPLSQKGIYQALNFGKEISEQVTSFFASQFLGCAKDSK